MGMLAPGGLCVSFGVSGAAKTTFDVRDFLLTGGARLYGFIIFHELLAYPASDGRQDSRAWSERGVSSHM